MAGAFGDFGGDNSDALSQWRAPILSDPAKRDRLMRYARAEVGGQGPQAQQAFMEAMTNMAGNRGSFLPFNYFPAITHQRAARPLTDAERAQYGPIADAVAGGSNIANYATGNASGTVGFAGGPQTYSAGGERFGVEGPDRGWWQKLGLEGPKAISTDQSSSGAGDETMPSLFDLYGVGGNPAPSWNDAIAQRQASLVGLGLGLMGGGWLGGMKGYEQGAQTDIAAARTAQQAREAAATLGLHRAQFEFQKQQAGITPFQRAQADIEKYKGTPQEDEARRFYAAQMGEAPSIQKITNPFTGEDESVLFNPRAPTGQQFTDIAGRPLAWATAATAPRPSTGPAPTTTLAPPPAGSPAARVADAFSAFPGAAGAPTTTGAGGTAAVPAYPQSPAEMPPRVGPKAFEPEQKLRKEFDDLTKGHSDVRNAYGRILAAPATGTGDLGLLYGYIKMISPTSRLNPGMVADAENTAGVPEVVRNLWNRVMQGDRLTDEHRAMIKDAASRIYASSLSDYDRLANQYRNRARQYRIDPAAVIPDLPPLQAPSAGHGGTTGGGRGAQSDPFGLR